MKLEKSKSPASKLEYAECNSSTGLDEAFLYLDILKDLVRLKSCYKLFQKIRRYMGVMYVLYSVYTGRSLYLVSFVLRNV